MVVGIYRLAALPIAAAILVASTAAEAKQARSYAAKAEFKREAPCPGNGNRRGPCPGYEIDHATPLKCGGADHKSNMQWLTVADHKEKTRREAAWCRRADSNN